MYATPGLTAFVTVGAGPIRAMHTSANFGLFVVSGDSFYQVNANNAVVFLGGGIATGVPAYIIDNGPQLAVFAGDSGFSWSSGAGWAAIAVPFTAASPIAATQQDGYGVITQPGSSLFFQSDLLDFTSWNALNFGDASADPDNLVAIVQLDRELWLIKNNHTEIWYNAGNLGLTFARLDGVYLEVGCVAQDSVRRLGSSLFWLARGVEGDGVVVQAAGHRAQRVSTHGLEDIWRQYPKISDAIAYGYQQDGHEFYVLNFPSGNATWVYDATTSAAAKTPMWHRRGALNPQTAGTFDRHFANAHAVFGGMNLVGDYRDGSIYSLDFSAATDGGTQRKWLRTWRALEKPADQPVRFSELRIDMQTGIGVPDGGNPQVMLRWSDDGGHVWSNQMFAAAGRPGDTARRVMFRRLGSTRRNSGLDRIFELSGSDPFQTAIIGAVLE
ncbi:MAG TPA: packaged DNA stabilization protein [Stellaceae bacterium]|nr:packaged DNA stabilization protein [Stellaceae bacterium]